jgi:hypothetical protein
MNWEKQCQKFIPLLGHRNWILVTDKAYPLQSAEGIRTIYTGESSLVVLQYVITSIEKGKHIRPIFYTDQELFFMREDLSKGIEVFKKDLLQLISGQEMRSIPHQEIFAKLDAASKLFNILVLKTESLMPYTSVFIELDCGYWSAEYEKILRERISEE